MGPMVLDEFLFTRKHAKGIVKIGLPGPSTVADCVADEYYQGDRKQLAFDYADAIHHEVAALIAAGCQVIQFDDPVLLRYPEAAQAWGLQALERCFAGLEDRATFVVHICCGYPNKPLERKGIAYKANQDYYRDILTWLSESRLDVVSIEGAACKLDVSILGAIGNKTVMLGVIDVGENEVESVESLVARANEALRFAPKGQLILAPDCGMLELTRASAREEARQPVAGGSRGQRAVKIVTYNIQYGLGKDNRYDLARIAREVEDADVIALQEVERHWQRSGCVDSPAVLRARFPSIIGSTVPISIWTRAIARRKAGWSIGGGNSGR